MKESKGVLADADAELSFAARETLNELLSEVRARAILEARRRAGEGTITATDIVEAFQTTSDRGVEPSQRARSRIRLLLVSYGLLGFVAVAAAGVTLALGGNSVTTLLIASTGLAFALSSGLVLLITFLRARASRGTDAESSWQAAFINLWISTESVVRQIASSRLGSSSNEVPFTQLLARLAKAKVLSEAEVEGLRGALRVRSAVLHSTDVSDTEIEHAGDFLAKFLRTTLKVK